MSHPLVSLTRLARSPFFYPLIHPQGADTFKAKIDIEVSQASQSAIAAIEKAGGSVLSTYHTPLAMRAMLQPEKFDIPIKAPKPSPKRIDYYLSFRNRGYLNPEVQLAQLRKRLAEGQPLEQAAALMQPFAGGGGDVPAARAPDLNTEAWRLVNPATAPKAAPAPAAAAPAAAAPAAPAQ